MKYIIDIPDNTHWIQWIMEGTKDHHPYMDWIDVKDLRFYTEPDRKAIEEEVWGLARRIICPSDCCEDSISKYTEKFLDIPSYKARAIFKDLSYQEVKAKYEEWLKQKDEIRVGDEVKDHEDIKAVVLDICMDGEAYTVYTENRICEDWLKDEGFVKTGRHFPEVAELLEKMRGEEE